MQVHANGHLATCWLNFKDFSRTFSQNNAFARFSSRSKQCDQFQALQALQGPVRTCSLASAPDPLVVCHTLSPTPCTETWKVTFPLRVWPTCASCIHNNGSPLAVLLYTCKKCKCFICKLLEWNQPDMLHKLHDIAEHHTGPLLFENIPRKHKIDSQRSR